MIYSQGSQCEGDLTQTAQSWTGVWLPQLLLPSKTSAGLHNMEWEEGREASSAQGVRRRGRADVLLTINTPGP